MPCMVAVVGIGRIWATYEGRGSSEPRPFISPRRKGCINPVYQSRKLLSEVLSMSVVNRVVVTCRLENGETVDVSSKAVGRGYNEKDVKLLQEKLERNILTKVEDTLYYQVRTWSGEGGKDRKNWSRIATVDELREILLKVMVRGCETAVS